MNSNTRTAVTFTGVLVAIIAVFVAFAVIQGATRTTPDPAATATDSAPTVAENSYKLDDVPDAKVTVVEFLDFECEACGAMYPYVEQARAKYAGQINYVIRYFPIPSHFNAQNAALAVEAAAQQGKLELMYNRMFETQSTWGESQVSKADLFRSFAQDLGLDMAAYDTSVADPKSLERITYDVDAGTSLGVQGTPTFFINDRKLELQTVNDLDQAIAAELAK